MTYDVVVIGAGPGGYVAAIRAAQLGRKTACVDSRASLGGTCLNIGCIPSKALLQSSEKFVEARSALAMHGVRVGEVGLDLGAMLARKDQVVTQLTRGVEYLFRKNNIDWLKGKARIAAPGRVAVAAADGTVSEVEAGAVVVASGSESTPLPGVAIDEERIVTSTGALAFDRVPRRLVVIGGGYIGLELGLVWRRLGAEVTVVELLDRIIPTMDRELGTALQRVLTRAGIGFRLGAEVTGIGDGAEGLTVALAGSETQSLSADAVLVAIGRRPYTEGLGLKRSALPAMRRAGSRSMTALPPTFPASTRSATRSAARCWRTRQWRKVRRWPSGWPDNSPRSTTTRSRRSFIPGPRSPRSGKPKTR